MQIALRLLGAVEVRSAMGLALSDLEGRQKRLAVLAYLGAAQPYGFQRRDRLIGQFWGDTTQEKARRALNQSLHVIREALGKDSVVSRGDAEIAINENVVQIDVREFDRAMESGDFATAVDRYQGEFLQSFYISRAPEFEQWADQERTRLRHAALRAAFSLVRQHENSGEYAAAVERSRWAARVAPLDEQVFRQHLELLDRHGDRGTALQEYDAFVKRLADDYGVDPSPETQALVSRIRVRGTPHAVPRTLAPPTPLDDMGAAEASADAFLDRLQQGLAGKYRIEREVGRGGMSIVYLAHDQQLDRQVAIKVLRPELVQSIAAGRFLKEIQIEASVEHPHVISIFDYGEAGGLPYHVMQYVQGESLRDRLKRERQLPIDEAVRITKEVGAALSAAHARGIIHRDIKPANILFAGDRAVVTDFGIARALTEAGAAELTVTGVAIGTPGYMSPEQATADAVDHRTDQYSLACVLYELLAGEMVFAGATARAIIAKHLAAPSPAVSVLRERAAHLDAVILKAMEKAPADRFASVRDFVRALETAHRKSIPSTEVTAPTSLWLRLTRAARNRPVTATTLAIGIMVGLAAIGYVTFGFANPAPWPDGRPPSILVQPFGTLTSSDAERTLAQGLSDEMTRELNHWDSILAIPQVSTSGALFDLGLRDPTLQRVEDGIALARRVRAEGLLAISVQLRGDSAYVTANLFDARINDRVGDPIQTAALADDTPRLLGPILGSVLGLEGDNLDPSALRRLSKNALSVKADLSGMRHLATWNLTDAEARFRDAIRSDSTFAVALHHLAQTLYWQNPTWLDDVGPEIARLSASALEHSTGVGHRDSLHIRAFYSFQEGDYQAARSIYHDILSADSTDVYAWLMLGAVEFHDPWLIESANGSLIPRSNLNVAIDAFAEALRLQPTFALGYGHMFDIYRQVDEAADWKICTGFDLPRDELLAPWEPRTPHQLRAFCPVMVDSIMWITEAAFTSLDPSLFQTGAQGLFQRSLRELRRWAAYSPQDVKPWEELTAAMLAQRARLELTAPRVIDSLTEHAFEYASRALSLKSDTLPIDYVNLGSFYLGMDNPDSAVALIETGLERYDVGASAISGSLPGFAANVFLATGQPDRALSIVSNTADLRFAYDSVENEHIPFGRGTPVIARLGVLGATGVGGPMLREELQKLAQIWSPPSYSARASQVLRGAVAHRIATALALDHATLASWVEGLELRDPLWRALFLAEQSPTVARAHLLQALEVGPPGLSDASRWFLLGLVASRINDHRLAAGLFSRLDSVPLGLLSYDVGWGLRSLSFLLRAKEYEADQESDLAIQYYERFATVWENADSLARPLVIAAQRGAARLRNARRRGAS